MSAVRFTGDEPLDIPSLGVQVAPGETIEVDADVAAGLLARPDFARPKKPSAPVAKKAVKSDEAPASTGKSKED